MMKLVFATFTLFAICMGTINVNAKALESEDVIPILDGAIVTSDASTGGALAWDNSLRGTVQVQDEEALLSCKKRGDGWECGPYGRECLF